MEIAYSHMLATVSDTLIKQRIRQLGFNHNDAIFRATEQLKAMRLQDKQGKELTFGQLVDRHLNQVIYLDIWASWCKLCRAEMPYAREVRQAYQDKPVSFVYVSIDKDQESWKKAVGEEQLQDLETSYVLENPGDFGLLRQEFKFTGIPHYVLIDPKGNVAFANAPRPSSDQLPKSLNDLLGAIPKRGEGVPPPPPPKRGIH